MMTNHKPISEDKYEGASKTTEVLGKAKVYGYAGSVIGALGFGTLASQSPKFSHFISTTVEKFENFIATKKTSWLGEKRAAQLNLGVVAGVAGAGWMVGHWAGTLFGVKKGFNKAGRGQEQFEKLKSERDAAKSELSSIKEQVAVLNETALNPTKHSDKVKTHGTHAEARESEKESAAEFVR